MQPLDLHSALNDEQRAAVEAPDGPVLVIAAAGTGKTRTLVYRVALLTERGTDPGRILLLTFTNRAAREMLERAETLVGGSVGGLWGGTFHHMANRILRRQAGLLGYRHDYTIADRDDARTLVKQCVEEKGLESKVFPKPDVLLSLFGYAASTEKPLRAVAQTRFERHPIDVDDILLVQRAYEERKRTLHLMDFDDLLVNGLKLFREHGDVLARYQERFLYILVDEYQDTNVIQSEWVDALAGGRRNLLVVGDDFQSIYAWRGADFRNILTFPKRYPDATVFKLETNYRSAPEILQVANACIAGNPEQFQKELRPTRHGYRKPRLVQLIEGYDQARYVIEEIRRLQREGYPLRQIAVLYRSHFQAMELQLEMSRERLPYVITSGARFFEQAHVKDVCSLLRLLANPEDELAFLRLVGLLPRVGQRTAARIWTSLQRSFNASDAGAREAFRRLLPAPARERYDEFAPILAAYAPEDLKRKPGEIIERFVAAFYDRHAVETFDNYQRRMEDLEELGRFTGQFDTVDEFLSEIALMTNLDAEPETFEPGADEAVRLSTVHQAKGLEWSAVFVIWLADGMFPSSRAVGEGNEDEERRLFYVAVTRAKDELFLCVPQCRRDRSGASAYYPPSRFIRELPANLLESHREVY